MKNSKAMRSMCAVICGVTLVTSLVACGGTKNSTGTPAATSAANQQAVTPETPVKITAMCPMYQAQPIKTDGNKVLETIQQTANCQLQVDWIPKPNYQDKLNVMVASSQLPMVTIAETNMVKSSNVMNAIKSGMFWEVTTLTDQYPNLKNMYSNPIIKQNASIEGKLYGLPRPRPVARAGLVYRKDWFDALGLKAPTNLDEFYQAAKALTLNDPDKNGKNDTIGYLGADITTGSTGWNGIDTIVTYLGGFNQWGVKAGKVTPAFMTNEYITALNVFRKLYQEKLMNQDFMLASGNKRFEPFNKGLAGMYFGTTDDAIQYHNDLYKIVPTAKLEVAPPFTGPDGKQRTNATTGSNGMVLFSKTAVKSEADLKKVVAVFDRMAATDMFRLLTYGIEGDYYTMENGIPKIKDQQLLNNNIGDLTNLFVEPPFTDLTASSEIANKVYAWQKSNEKIAVANAIDPFVSQTQTEKGGELDKLLMDARIKFVMGEIDEAGYKKIVNDWYTRGGEKIIQEYTEQYNKVAKK